MESSELQRPTSPARRARGDRRQVDVAKDAGIAVSYLSMIENGLRPSRAVAERLAVVLELTPQELGW